MSASCWKQVSLTPGVLEVIAMQWTNHRALSLRVKLINKEEVSRSMRSVVIGRTKDHKSGKTSGRRTCDLDRLPRGVRGLPTASEQCTLCQCHMREARVTELFQEISGHHQEDVQEFSGKQNIY